MPCFYEQHGYPTTWYSELHKKSHEVVMVGDTLYYHNNGKLIKSVYYIEGEKYVRYY